MGISLETCRHGVQRTVLKALCAATGGRATDRSAAPPTAEAMYRARVLGGPLRGRTLTMPGLERLSYALGTYEGHVVRTIRRHVRPGSIAYDVGANAGYLTLVMALCVGREGKVFAFEPDPRNTAALEENLTRNSLAQVRTVAQAVSSESGVVEFATFEYTLVGHIATGDTPADARLVRVPAVSLDDFVYGGGNPAPHFLKIDVEGAEDSVLLGSQRVLAEARPSLLVEVRMEGSCDTVPRLLQARGYRQVPVESGPRVESEGFADVLFVPA